MSIEHWGAIGELIGAAAVIVSLIYLARQIRLAARADSVATIRELQRDLRQVLDDPSERQQALAKRDFAGEMLTRQEENRLGRRLTGQMRVYEAMWFAHDQGLLPATLLEGYLVQCSILLYGERSRRRWAHIRSGFHPEFCAWLDDYLARRPYVWSQHDWLREESEPVAATAGTGDASPPQDAQAK